MRRRSLKGQRLDALYRVLRLAWLEEHPWCQYPPGCGRQATTIQHRYGKNGPRLVDRDWWASSCLEHNLEAESHTTGFALEIGWLVKLNSYTEHKPWPGGDWRAA